MKFTSNTYIHDLYGYTFKPGIPVEVNDERLARKFSKLSVLEEVKDAMQEQGQTPVETRTGPAIKAGAMTRKELLAEAESLGLDFSPYIRTPTLREMVEAHGRQ